MLRDSSDCSVMRAQWAAVEEAKRAGKTRAIGVVNYCQGSLQCILDTAKEKPAINYYMDHIGMGPDPQGLSHPWNHTCFTLVGWLIRKQTACLRRISTEELREPTVYESDISRRRLMTANRITAKKRQRRTSVGHAEQVSVPTARRGACAPSRTARSGSRRPRRSS